MFGSNGCLAQKAAGATFGRIRIGPIQMGSFTNGIKEDYRIELGLKKNLGSDLLGWIRDAGKKALNPEKGASPPDAAHVCTTLLDNGNDLKTALLISERRKGISIARATGRQRR